MIASFEVNDRITFSGAEGTVTKITDDPYSLMYDFPVHVIMDNGMHLHFTNDGRFMSTQKYPVIVKIGKVQPKIRAWIVAYLKGSEWRITTEPYSDEEIRNGFHGVPHQKIEESMVEF